MSKKQEKPTILCPNCGEENTIYAAFCKACSGRIYKDGAGPDAFQDPRKLSRKRAVRNFISSVVVLGLVAAGVLALWPLPVSDIPTTTARNPQVRTFLNQVSALQGSGRAVPDVKISQASLNGFLGTHSDQQAGKLLGAVLSEDRILIMSSEPLGPLSVSSRLEIRADTEQPGSFMPVQLFIGQLPLPVSLAPFWAERLIEEFQLNVDLDALDALRIRRTFRNGMVVGADPSS